MLPLRLRREPYVAWLHSCWTSWGPCEGQGLELISAISICTKLPEVLMQVGPYLGHRFCRSSGRWWNGVQTWRSEVGGFTISMTRGVTVFRVSWYRGITGPRDRTQYANAVSRYRRYTTDWVATDWPKGNTDARKCWYVSFSKKKS